MRPPYLYLFLLILQVLADVTWDSPTAGDVYVPGDTLQAVWTSPERVISPSFTICTDDSSTDASSADCGTAVWPTVNQNGTEYSISLAVPNITGNGDYYLVMKDDQGTTYDTPNFSLALTKIAAITNSTSNLSPPQPPGNTITYLPSRSPSIIAAIAVPLSLVAVTLVVALLLLVSRMRRSKRERDKEKQKGTDGKADGSQQTVFSFATASELERAVLKLATSRGYPEEMPAHPALLPPGASPIHPSLRAAAAAALGLGAFGWAHGYGQPAALPPVSDAYTPPLVPQYVTSNLRHASPTPAPAPTPASASTPPQVPHHDPRIARMFAAPTPPPQPPAIQLHASTPPSSLPFPGTPPPAPLTPGSGASASLNVIAGYTHPSPVIPLRDSLAPPPHIPTRARSLRRLETTSEAEKRLPLSEGRAGSDLYAAVSRAVGQ